MAAASSKPEDPLCDKDQRSDTTSFALTDISGYLTVLNYLSEFRRHLENVLNNTLCVWVSPELDRQLD